MTDLERNICYICGKENADTDDHIPPQNLFIKRFKNIGEDLLTARSHRSCNKKYELDDEYFRIFLTAPVVSINFKAKELWDTKVLRSLKRTQAKKFKKYLSNSVNFSEIFSPSGIYSGTYPVLLAEYKRVDDEVNRIVRGIIYNKSQMILPLDYHIEVSLMSPIKKYLREKLIFSSYCDKTFQFAWKHSPDFIDGFFWLIFFDEIDFWITTSKTPINNSPSVM